MFWLMIMTLMVMPLMVNIFDGTGTAVITSTASSIQVIPATNSLEQINFRYTSTDVNGAHSTGRVSIEIIQLTPSCD